MIDSVVVGTSIMISIRVMECEDNDGFTWIELAIGSSYQSHN
jgi:hypothetical protein